MPRNLINYGVQCWEYNYAGALGDGTTTTAGIVVESIAQNSGATSVGAGAEGNHSCAVVSGAVQCWGSNQYGQLGTGDTTDHYTPVAGPTF